MSLFTAIFTELVPEFGYAMPRFDYAGEPKVDELCLYQNKNEMKQSKIAAIINWTKCTTEWFEFCTKGSQNLAHRFATCGIKRDLNTHLARHTFADI